MSAGTEMRAALGTLESGVEIAVPASEPGIGKIILSPSSTDLIEDVEANPFPLWPDDRGYFLEVARLRQGLIRSFALESTQVSAALNYPGIIKAFHFHRFQTDYWVAAAGLLQVALVDLRRGSRTHGLKNTFYVGPMRPWQLLIPPGIAHGYKVIGEQPSVLIYITNRTYDPKDEGRIPYNDASIAYDWELQHK
ncbi:MAG: dTDP-4-dehydrorhamnose 3,5-epimerase family protein [Acidobacteriaceae bacterium]|nr:dTDP-4-dehydrorhamnose 3,5-epimerase family protein [Acidobacteriaceae bacterium]MBV9781132.1 dTDP-4-dehydrorhamnose 3,5-epimerase family protein [Acidobacteriaceae bacterium]